MRILLISNGFPPRHWAGTETYTAGIAKELSRRGHEVHVLCVGDWESGPTHYNGYEDEEYQGVPVRRLNLNWKRAPDPFRYLYDNPHVARILKSHLKILQPDLVHVTSCETMSASVLRVTKEAQLPLVLSITDFWFLCPRISLLRSDGELCNGLTSAWECLRCQLRDSKAYRWPSQVLPEAGVSRLLTNVSRHPRLTRLRGLRGLAGDMAARKAFLRQALSWPDCRITASEYVRHIFETNGIKEEIRVQPYGHDLSWLAQYAGKSYSEVSRFGFIGQISERKGVHLLLKAGQLLRVRYGGRFSLSIYGNLEKDPAYAASLRALAAGSADVKFCGTYPHEEMAAVFANLDVLIVPSLWHDFPLVIHEAFASRTPVIATNLGGMAEVVEHEVNGLLFERADAQDLANKMSRFLDASDLPAKLATGIGAVKSIEEGVSELESAYGELTSPYGHSAKRHLDIPAQFPY